MTPTPTPDRGAPGRYQNAAIVGIAVLVVGIGATCVQFKVPTIMTAIAPEFGLSDAASAWLMSIFTLMGIIFSLPIGSLVQKLGFKRVIIGSAALMVCGSIIGLCAFGNGIVLLISRAIEGLALTCVMASGPVAVEQTVNPKQVGFSLGLWGCCGNGGSVIASVITPQIYLRFSFAGVWIAFIVILIAAVVLFAALVKSPATNTTAQPDDEPAPTSATPQTPDASAAPLPATTPHAPTHPPRYRDLLRPNIFVFLISWLALNLMMLSILGLLPSVLMLPEKGFSMELSGIANMVAPLLAIISTPIFGAIADRIGRVKPLLVFTLATFGPSVFLMYTQIGPLFWVGAVCLGVFSFASLGLTVTAWMRVVPYPELRPKGMGVFTFVQCIGQFFGTFLVQFMLGPTFGNWFFAACILLAIGVVGTLCAAFARYR